MVIRRRKSARTGAEAAEPRGFDGYDLRLGDLMRGERATLGKSLLDVERDIRIRATYIAAIENANPDAFDTPGFIPGYVRSYARYLGMDPDEAFAKFCAECGFSVSHGMSVRASIQRKPAETGRRGKKSRDADPLITPSTPFLPERESIFARVEPGALGSALVLVGLIAGIGYGGWSVLTEIQRVQVAPVENAPDVLTDLDPLEGVLPASAEDPARIAGMQPAPVAGGFDRLYRPEALDLPVMVARDAPIATLRPGEIGTLYSEPPGADRDSIESAIASAISPDIAVATPKVVADLPPEVRVVAVRPAWVRISAADGSIVFEGILNGGDTYAVPASEEAPSLRVGDSGAVYFEVEGQHYGPVGQRGSVTSGLSLAAAELTGRYDMAQVEKDRDFERYVAQLDSTGAAGQ